MAATVDDRWGNVCSTVASATGRTGSDSRTPDRPARSPATAASPCRTDGGTSSFATADRNTIRTRRT